MPYGAAAASGAPRVLSQAAQSDIPARLAEHRLDNHRSRRPTDAQVVPPGRDAATVWSRQPWIPLPCSFVTREVPSTLPCGPIALTLKTDPRLRTLIAVSNPVRLAYLTTANRT